MAEHQMTADEARDWERAQSDLRALQGVFNAIATRAQKRLGLPPGRLTCDIDRCVWVVPEPEAPKG